MYHSCSKLLRSMWPQRMPVRLHDNKGVMHRTSFQSAAWPGQPLYVYNQVHRIMVLTIAHVFSIGVFHIQQEVHNNLYFSATAILHTYIARANHSKLFDGYGTSHCKQQKSRHCCSRRKHNWSPQPPTSKWCLLRSFPTPCIFP